MSQNSNNIKHPFSRTVEWNLKREKKLRKMAKRFGFLEKSNNETKVKFTKALDYMLLTFELYGEEIQELWNPKRSGNNFLDKISDLMPLLQELQTQKDIETDSQISELNNKFYQLEDKIERSFEALFEIHAENNPTAQRIILKRKGFPTNPSEMLLGGGSEQNE